MVDLKGKVAIVTGAGSGMGEAIAQDLVACNAITIFIGRTMAKLESATENLPEDLAIRYSCDVSNREQVNHVVSDIVARFGRIDILVNNAGINTTKRETANIDPEDWDRVIAINLTGTFNMVRAALPTMREQGEGLIINVSSIAGVRASKMAGAAYSASKHGMVALTNNINQEEWEQGIRATAICPGEVNTPLLDKRPTPVSAERREQMVQSSDISASVLYVAGLSQYANVPLIVIKPNYSTF
jgi:NAD(P)-dependent dehydrogenase (short-subunit alcohol dehydrogenase family)